MCIAIYKPAGKNVSKKTLKRCWEENPDGGGFMYVSKGAIQITKEVNSFKAWYSKYIKAITANPDKNFVLHFRIATSGKIDLRNCHPFRVNNNLAFCHNGIINIKMPKNSKISDTVTFRNKILRMLPEKWYENEAIIKLIEKFIGSSKLVFLKSTGDVFIINEEKGIWDKDVWYSNTGYKRIGTIHWDHFLMEDYNACRFDNVCPNCGAILGLQVELDEGYCVDCLSQYMTESELTAKLKSTNEYDLFYENDTELDGNNQLL